MAGKPGGRRASLASSQTRYPYILLESKVRPSSLVDQLSTWLQATKQGMWIWQLLLAEKTVCLGWLLFSAPKYDRSELRRIIKEILGEDVALHFHTIHKGTHSTTVHDKNTVKAIHMEVDINLSSTQRQRITSLYLSSAQSFPIDIKMRLVPKFSEVPKATTQAKILQLLDCQAWFLIRSATSKLSPASHSNLTMAQMMNLLQSMSQTYLSTNQTVTPLFHAITLMTKSRGCIIRYLPQHHTAVLETLAQLQTFLPGFQAP